jgi:protein arginine N-methyltransferase 1
MYRLADYRAMILDEVRTPAYVRAIEQAVRPGDTVVEIGTGFGYFAVIACRAGASRVYAIDPDPVVHLGPELARANGFGDRIEFLQGLSTRVTVGPADVLISDLRGTLPLLGRHIPAIVDARRRLLKPGGAQIPARDWIKVALVGESGADQPVHPAPANGVRLDPVERALTHLWSSARLKPDDLVSEPATWTTLDYRTIGGPDLDGTVILTAARPACVRGLGAWFETELLPGCGFSTAPGGPGHVYGHALFPLPRPIEVEAGDVLEVRLRADLVGADYVWSWEGRSLAPNGRGAAFAQSTFHAAPPSAARLRRRGDRFEPALGREGQAQAWILGRMSGAATLGEIARGAREAFPDVFADYGDALRRVADLSEEFSR